MTLDFRTADRIAYLSFNRPEKLNALRDEDVADLIQALRRFDQDHEADVAILFGQGRAFSAGADISSRLQASLSAGSVRDRINEHDVFYQSENWKPVIAAVHGYCLGHALLTALLCDQLVAARDAVFQITEITIGLPGGLYRSLNSRPMFAMELALTGRHFTAEEAWDAGMVTRLVEVGDHVTAAEDLARLIMKNPQFAVREQVRVRRNLAAEEGDRMRTAFGKSVRAWTNSTEAQDRIADKLAKRA